MSYMEALLFHSTHIAGVIRSTVVHLMNINDMNLTLSVVSGKSTRSRIRLGNGVARKTNHKKVLTRHRKYISKFASFFQQALGRILVQYL